MRALSASGERGIGSSVSHPAARGATPRRDGTMPDAHPQETELKFVAASGRAPKLEGLDAALGGAEPRLLTSIYYDTEKRVLARAGLALRVRRDGETFTQTLKDAGDGAITRGEWEASVDGPEPSLRRLRGTPAARVLQKGVRLEPQFAVEVRRRTAMVKEGDTSVEISLDEGIARARGKEAPFIELECEMKGGPPQGLFALSRKLVGGSDLTLSFTTKAERGAQLANPPRSFARKFRPPRLSADVTAARGFEALALACVVQITSNAERLRQRASPEVIHQLRVGLRRLRSALSSFKHVVADTRLPAIKDELKWLSGELDAARNLDVLLRGDYRSALVRKETPQGLKGLGSNLRAARRAAYVRAAAAVESDRFRRLALELLIWAKAGPWTQDPALAEARRQPLEQFAARDLARRRRKILRCGRRLRALDPQRRHKLRIAAKKLRYGSDAFVPLFDRPNRTRAFIDALKELQDALGELNDVVVGERIVHDAIQTSSPEPAYVAGRIAGDQEARIQPLLDRAEAAFASFEAAKPFWR